MENLPMLEEMNSGWNPTYKGPSQELDQTFFQSTQRPPNSLFSQVF